MSDYSAASLWASSLTQADGFTRCSGCGDPVEPEDRCYADWEHIWHAGCWPRIAPDERRREPS